MGFEMLAIAVAHASDAIAHPPVVVADELPSIVHLRLSCFPIVDAGWLVFELDVFAVGRDVRLSGI